MGRAAAAGRPDAAPRRVRPAAGGRRARSRDDGDLADDDAARRGRGRRRRATWGQVVVLKGAHDGHRRARRRGRGRAVREPGPRHRRHRRRARRDRSARCSRQGLEPFAAARLGVYLHGLAGDQRPRALRRRRPARLRPARGDRAARPRSAWPAIAERAPRPPKGRLGFAPRKPDRRRPAPAPIASRSTAASAAAGLPPLPRTAWLEIDLDALVANLAALRALGPARHRRSGRSSRPTRTATGRSRSRGRCEEAGADGLCVATFDEALELRDAGHRGADPRPLPDPGRAGRRRGATLGVAVSAGDPVLLAGCSTASRPRAGGRADLGDRARGRERARPRTGSTRARPAGGRGGDPRRRAACGSAGLWTHLQAARGPAAAPSGQLGPVRGGRGRPARRPASTCRAATRPRAAASCSGDVGRLRRRPAGPRHLRPGPRRAPPGTPAGVAARRAPAAGPLAPRAAGPRRSTCRPGRGSATGRRS